MTFFRRIGSSIAAPYMPLYVQEMRGMIEGSALVTGLISAGASVMSAAAAISLSRLGDRHDKKRLIIIYLTAAIAISIMLLFTKTLTGFAIFYYPPKNTRHLENVLKMVHQFLKRGI